MEGLKDKSRKGQQSSGKDCQIAMPDKQTALRGFSTDEDSVDYKDNYQL
jgi:hypothetical protein